MAPLLFVATTLTRPDHLLMLLAAGETLCTNNSNVRDGGVDDEEAVADQE